MYKKLFSIFITTILLMCFFGCGNNDNNTLTKESYSNNIIPPNITVAIPPIKTFVKWIGGDTIEVSSLIPPGSSPSNYQLTSSQIKELSKSSLYFSIGLPSEKASILNQVKDNAKNSEIIYLDNLTLEKFSARYFDENNKGQVDPHIWLSPKRASYIIEIICKELSEKYPDNKKEYEQNLEKYKKKLNDLDEKVKDEVSKMKSRHFIIFHPSYGYFADDYNLTMIALEKDGKKASPKRFKELINYAREHNIKIVFFQSEMDSSQAKALSNEINGKAVMLEPLSENYFESFDKLLSLLKEVNNNID